MDDFVKFFILDFLGVPYPKGENEERQIIEKTFLLLFSKGGHFKYVKWHFNPQASTIKTGIIIGGLTVITS